MLQWNVNYTTSYYAKKPKTKHLLFGRRHIKLLCPSSKQTVNELSLSFRSKAQKSTGQRLSSYPCNLQLSNTVSPTHGWNNDLKLKIANIWRSPLFRSFTFLQIVIFLTNYWQHTQTKMYFKAKLYFHNKTNFTIFPKCSNLQDLLTSK